MAEVDIRPQFGAELKDGYKPVNAWVANGIDWLDDVQQFYRERSAIEKEYATKLGTLARKYFEKKAKRTSSLSVGDTPTTTPGSLESASMTTWAVQLTTLESRAAEHERFSSELITNLAEPVKLLHGRCEELRKQHADFAVKLDKERETTYGDLKKVKGKYDGCCQEVENRRKKIDSSFDASKQKAQGAYQHQLADMHNAKNSYLISINVTNKQKERHYHEYVPDLLDSLQDLSESRVAKLNRIWAAAATMETSTLSRSAEYLNHLASEIPRNNPLLDSMMFVRHNASQWRDPPDFVFEPSPVWHDDDTMMTNEPAKVFLRNILGKSKSQLGELRRDSDKKRRDVEGLQRTKQNIRDGKESKDEIEVAKAFFAMQEEYHEVERRKVTAEIEVSTITTVVGDISFGAINHKFKSQTFKIPTNCDLCGERIWGLSAKGFDCRDCGFTCHSKCEMKVPANCPGEQNKEERKRLKAERQEAAHATQAVDDPIPERQATMPPPLERNNTVNSMNTLSSGYAANANRSFSESVQPPGDGDNNDAASIAAAINNKPPTSRAKPRLVAPPPAQYIKYPESNGASSNEKRAKMIYSYQETGEGEISVSEGKEVVILEPDDGSGWMKVRAGSEEGLVPAAYAEAMAPPAAAPTSNHHPYPSSDDARPESTYSASSASLVGSTSGAPTKKKGPAVAPRRGAKKLKHVEALYPYEARSDAEHSMAEGERFVLVNADAGDGWADVEKGGMTRSVPANYIQEVN